MKVVASAVLAASLLSSAGLVGAAPVPEPHLLELVTSVLDNAALSVSQAANVNVRMLCRGPRALGYVYRKFGVEPPQDLLLLLTSFLSGPEQPKQGSVEPEHNNEHQTKATHQGEVLAQPELFDVEYLSAVQIGTPPQTLMLDIDTGSSDLWVFSSETPAESINGQRLYDISASSSAKRLDGQFWSMTYGDKSKSSGNVYTDVVTLGGVTVAAQAVESATHVSSSFTKDNSSSGLLGLAFDHINQVKPTKQKTFLSNAMDQLALPLFTANLKKGQAGNYNFGSIDETEYDGAITYIPVNSTRGFWEFTTTGFSIGNSQTITAAQHQGIADTGTTLLILPSEIVSAYYASVKGAILEPSSAGWVFPCDAALPDLTLHMEGYAAVVPGDVIRFSPANADSFEKATQCFGGLQSADGVPFSIYGDVFFKGQFVVFDAGQKRLGFASKAL